MKKLKLRISIISILAITMFFSIVITVSGESISKEITAHYNNIKIYINNDLISPKDANGNEIEPFIYNGTTYLPVRAVAEAFNEEVSWDGNTNSVYIGSKPEKEEDNALKPDFRNVQWGMSKEEVKKYENSELTSDIEEGLGYQNLRVARFDTVLTYHFNVNNELFSAGYYLIHEHSNKNDFIDDFDYLKELLIEKYGEPKEDEIIWKDDLYKDDPSDWGMAIFTGDLIYKSLWENEDLIVELRLKGDNYKKEFTILYKSKEISDEISREEGEGL
jgi:hypothetical protein